MSLCVPVYLCTCVIYTYVRVLICTFSCVCVYVPVFLCVLQLVYACVCVYAYVFLLLFKSSSAADIGVIPRIFLLASRSFVENIYGIPWCTPATNHPTVPISPCSTDPAISHPFRKFANPSHSALHLVVSSLPSTQTGRQIPTEVYLHTVRNL